MNITEISKGISHIEDLPIGSFIDILANLREHVITEKVDGAEIIFGIDDNGFYTSRESKGGSRIYCVEDYNIAFPTTYMRSAHMLLEQALPSLRAAGLKRGDQVEAEVLYGGLPNVVPYSADRNYLIFLRTTEGNVNIDRLKQKLYGQTLSVSLQVPFTDDGRTISLKEDFNVWEFSRAPIIQAASIQGIKNRLSNLCKFLDSRDIITKQTYKTLLETPLNKIPEWIDRVDWKEAKLHIKERKEDINDALMLRHVLPLKELLLNHLVRNRKSQFGPLIEDGGWIEGVVLTNSAGRMVKLVDKAVFGTIREIAWEKRNYLTEHARSIDGYSGFTGRLLRDMASAIGHPELGTMQAKKYLQKAGVFSEDGLHLFSEGVNFNATQAYWLNLLKKREHDLDKELDKYLKESNILLNGNVILTQGVKKRTLETFAGVFEQIKRLRVLTEKSQNVSDLLLILAGKHIGICMRLDEIVSLNNVLSMNQYLKLLSRVSTKLGSDIDTTHLKNQIIQSWKKGLKTRKFYNDLLSTVNVSLSDLLE